MRSSCRARDVCIICWNNNNCCCCCCCCVCVAAVCVGVAAAVEVKVGAAVVEAEAVEKGAALPLLTFIFLLWLFPLLLPFI
jgi:hypothetical protein